MNGLLEPFVHAILKCRLQPLEALVVRSIRRTEIFRFKPLLALIGVDVTLKIIDQHDFGRVRILDEPKIFFSRFHTTYSSSANHDGAKFSSTSRRAMSRNRASVTVVNATILGNIRRHAHKKSCKPGRGIWLTAFEMSVPSKSRASTVGLRLMSCTHRNRPRLDSSARYTNASASTILLGGCSINMQRRNRACPIASERHLSFSSRSHAVSLSNTGG